MSEKGTYVCGYCGSNAIQASASATWSERKQQWEILDRQDWPDDYCDNCEAETSLEWIKYSDQPERVGSRKVILLPTDVDDVFDGPYSTQCLKLLGQKIYLTEPVNEDIADSMLILRKVNKWQWEIINVGTTDQATA